MANYRDIAAELQRRKNDGLAMFRATTPDMPAWRDGWNDQGPFFRSQASECLIRGGNRSSKSTSSAVLFAAIARDKSIYTHSGEVIEARRPWQKNRPLLMWIIGLQINHFTTIYRLLFRAGLYKIIRDKDTGDFRAYCPWDPEDKAREKEVRPSFPLIPQSEVDPKSWSWEQKASKQFTHVSLPGKAEIFCYASTADVKQGDPVDVIWIDEAISNPEHYQEWQMRLPDTKGRIFWSSWPSKGNPALIRLTERAREQQEQIENGDRTKPDVEEFVYTFSGNPFIDDEEKRKVHEGLTDEELKSRDLGEYALESTRVYPFFDRDLCRAIYRNPEQDDEISRVLRENNGIPPRDWTHELILDPGTAKPAVLFCAVPPPSMWGGPEPIYVAYKEIYRPRLSAEQIAKAVRAETPDGVTFNRFIIDGQAARQTPMGFSGTIGRNYSKAFEAIGLRSEQTGTEFFPGDPNFANRSMKVQQLLSLRGDGRPSLRIVLENCPGLVWQMENNQRSIQKEQVLEKEAPGQRNDVRVCLEYWISVSPRYVAPKHRHANDNRWEQFKKWRDKTFGKKEDTSGIKFGPGEAA